MTTSATWSKGSVALNNMGIEQHMTTKALFFSKEKCQQ